MSIREDYRNLMLLAAVAAVTVLSRQSRRLNSGTSDQHAFAPNVAPHHRRHSAVT
jgi:hypothetical protein